VLRQRLHTVVDGVAKSSQMNRHRVADGDSRNGGDIDNGVSAEPQDRAAPALGRG